jgi:hypothetical protein
VLHSELLEVARQFFDYKMANGQTKDDLNYPRFPDFLPRLWKEPKLDSG